MTKQEQIREMVTVMIASNNPFVDVPIEIMPKVAVALYNAGYRKTFTSDLASDTIEDYWYDDNEIQIISIDVKQAWAIVAKNLQELSKAYKLDSRIFTMKKV